MPRRCRGGGESEPPVGWPVEWTCTGIVTLFVAMCWSLRHHFFSAGQCTSLSGMCTPAQCECAAPLLKQELVTQDEQACFRCITGFCPVVSAGETQCSTLPCECEDPKWSRIDLQLDGEPCWQCVRPSLDFTMRASSAEGTCFAMAAGQETVTRNGSDKSGGAGYSAGRMLVNTHNALDCIAFSYNGVRITEKRWNQSCLAWHPFGAYWGLTTCDSKNPRMHFGEVTGFFEGDAGQVPRVYCSGDNQSEFCVEVAERLCTEDEGRCSTEICRCADASWTKLELETLEGYQRCYRCVPPPRWCSTSEDTCTAGVCECASPGHVKVRISLLAESGNGEETGCFRCQAPAQNSWATVLILIVIGLVGGSCAPWLFGVAMDRERPHQRQKESRMANAGTGTWSERWAVALEDGLEDLYGIFIEGLSSSWHWGRVRLRHVGKLLDYILDALDVLLEPCYCLIDIVQAPAWNLMVLVHERLVFVVGWVSKKMTSSEGVAGDDWPDSLTTMKGKAERRARKKTEEANKGCPNGVPEASGALRQEIKSQHVRVAKVLRSSPLDGSTLPVLAPQLLPQCRKAEWDPLSLYNASATKPAADAHREAADLPAAPEEQPHIVVPGPVRNTSSSSLAQSPTAVQSRMQRKLHQRREALAQRGAAAAAEAEASPLHAEDPPAPLDESWIDELEQREQKAKAAAASKKAAKSSRTKERKKGSSSSKDSSTQKSQNRTGTGSSEAAGSRQDVLAAPHPAAAKRATVGLDAREQTDADEATTDEPTAEQAAAEEDVEGEDTAADEAIIQAAAEGARIAEAMVELVAEVAPTNAARMREAHAQETPSDECLAGTREEVVEEGLVETAKDSEAQVEEAVDEGVVIERAETEEKETDEGRTVTPTNTSVDVPSASTNGERTRPCRRSNERKTAWAALDEEWESRGGSVDPDRLEGAPRKQVTIAQSGHSQTLPDIQSSSLPANTDEPRRSTEKKPNAGARAAKTGTDNIPRTRRCDESSGPLQRDQCSNAEAPAESRNARTTRSFPAERKTAWAKPDAGWESEGASGEDINVEHAPSSRSAKTLMPDTEPAPPGAVKASGSTLMADAPEFIPSQFGQAAKGGSMPQQSTKKQKKKKKQGTAETGGEATDAFGEIQVTTITASGISGEHTNESLLKILDSWGMLGTFDFLFVPVNAQSQLNTGFAVINFVDPAFVPLFCNVYQASNLGGMVTPADIQGRDANLEQWRFYATPEETRFKALALEGTAGLGFKPSGLPPDPVCIESVEEGSWAAKNGVLVGDVLTSINGWIVEEMTEDELLVVKKERPLQLMFSRQRYVSEPIALLDAVPSQWAVNAVNSMLSPPVGQDHFRKTKLCSFHEQGRCELGTTCPFAHGRAELQPSPDLAKTKLCYNYFRGRCGDARCKFAHGSRELRWRAVSGFVGVDGTVPFFGGRTPCFPAGGDEYEGLFGQFEVGLTTADAFAMNGVSRQGSEEAPVWSDEPVPGIWGTAAATSAATSGDEVGTGAPGKAAVDTAAPTTAAASATGDATSTSRSAFEGSVRHMFPATSSSGKLRELGPNRVVREWGTFVEAVEPRGADEMQMGSLTRSWSDSDLPAFREAMADSLLG